MLERDRERYRKLFGKRDDQKEYWAHTLCAHCYAECPIRVKVIDGKPVSIEGVADTGRGGQGGLCAKGVAGLMHYYDPDRILYPVKRTNPRKGLREDPQWERISWDEAMDTIAEKLKAVHKKDPRSALFGMTPGPTGGMMATVNFLRFCGAFGGTHLSGGPSVMCGASAHHIGALHHAAWDILPDYRYCNYILRAGGSEGWGGGRIAAAGIKMLAAARDRGLKMKVMDPQGFTVASKGDEWIPILPGMDVAVFLAMANLIVNEIGIYDAEYIRHKTNGPYLVGPNKLFMRDGKDHKPLLFDEADGKVKTYDDPTLKMPTLDGKYTVEGVECRPAFAIVKEHLKQYKPEWAQEVSTVPAATIRRLARELVEEAKIGSTIDINGVKVPYRPACVVGYKGLQTHSNSHHQYTAMELLNVLIGCQDVCGGLLASGVPRSLGYPETGGFTFSPFQGLDGMLMCGAWPIGWQIWPPRKVEGPGTKINFQDVLAHSGSNIYPLAEDWEELWKNAGGTFYPEFYMIYGVNIVMNIVRPEAVEKLLKKIDFICAFQPYHNETTEGFCDIVLPSADFLEFLDIAPTFGVVYNFPIGMDKWSIHVRMPVTEPKGESRILMDFMNDLADKVGIRRQYNALLDDFYTFRKARQAGNPKTEIPPIFRPDENLHNTEFVDKVLKYHFGPERGLEWFRDNGYMTWDKKPEEAYWRWFIDARIPLYYEAIEADKEEMLEKCEKIGFRFNRDYFTALTSYWPACMYTELPPDSEYDLLIVSPHESSIIGRFSVQNPHINQLAERNPYTYNITLNSAAARKRGIKEGDMISLENSFGDKVTGPARLSELVHPQVVVAIGLGGWAKGRRVAQSKGVNPNQLLRQTQYRFDPLSGASEPCVRVKAYVENSAR